MFIDYPQIPINEIKLGGESMKSNILLILVVILMVVSVVLVSYQISSHKTITGLESHIASLDTKLTQAESTIVALNQRIELLENGNHESQTETDMLETLQGKTYWAYVGNMGYMQIRFGACLDLSK